MLRRLTVLTGSVCGLLYAQTASEVVLHRFAEPPKGANPGSSLTRDAAGNFYGTAQFGGINNLGTVFKISPDGRATVIHNFKGGADGATPVAGVILDAAGNIYGTTTQGGAKSACSSGCGVVFKVDPVGNESVLYSFSGGADGSDPIGGVVLDSAGDLYGTASGGGIQRCGVVYQLSAAGVQTVLHSFSGFRNMDGCSPRAGVIRDSDGNLYGTTYWGGSHGDPGAGTVYKLDSSNQETVLYSFIEPTGGESGGFPTAGVIRDADGNLYGTTSEGGLNGYYGVVFKLDNANQYTVLHHFSGGDGFQPNGLIRDAAGNLYGTTRNGGGSNAGVVFKINPAGERIILYEFTGGADGGEPLAGVTADSNGNIFGAASSGGRSSVVNTLTVGLGVVYKLDSAGEQSVLYTFTGPADGTRPSGQLTGDAAGNLYGTTSLGGVFNAGTVYELDATGEEKVLHTFTGGTDGMDPETGVIRDPAGNLYGTTTYGGPANAGVLFGLDVSGHYSLLHSFTGGADGGVPVGRLFREPDGSLYGVAEEGLGPGGVLYKLDASGNYTVLHHIPYHSVSGVIRDPSGNFYGTASNLSRGAIYKIDASGNFTTWAVLHAGPVGELYRDPAGNIFGIDEDVAIEVYHLYKADNTGHVTVRYTFTGVDQDKFASGDVIQDSAGNLYGTASGGANGCGEVYKIDPAGQETILYTFSPDQSEGCVPGDVIRDSSGNLYGVAGGPAAGVIFKVKVE